MTTICPIDACNALASYNAVKIQVNDPRTIIPEGFKGNVDDHGIYNAANIQINRPTVEVKKDTTYEYPENKEVVTYEQAQIQTVKVPAPNVTDVEAEKKNLI